MVLLFSVKSLQDLDFKFSVLYPANQYNQKEYPQIILEKNISIAESHSESVSSYFIPLDKLLLESITTTTMKTRMALKSCYQYLC